MKALKRFFKCLRLNLRPIVGKHPLLFLLILAQMTVLFHSVDRAISFALLHYDYVGAYFDHTEETYVALSLNSASANRTSSSRPSQELWQEIYQACGETPLVTFDGTILEDGSAGYVYSPELFGIERPVQAGRWLTEEDAETYGCVVSADLAAQYPVGSTVSCTILTGGWGEGEDGGWLHETRNYHVVGVLADGECPLTSTYQDATYSLSTLMKLDYNQPFAIFPAEYNRYFAGLTMWFRTDRPAEELQELLKDYGTVITQEELVKTYQSNALKTVFLDTPYMVVLLLLSLLLVVSVMVMSFGGNRRHWSVLYLLGQSQRMLTGCIAAIYTATILLAYLAHRVWLCLPWLEKDIPWMTGELPSISVAQISVVGVTLLSILCVGGVVLAFFRHSPMELFADNK